MSIIDVLSAYAAKLRWQDLPSAVQHKTKELVLDSLGCAVGGTMLAASRAMVAMVAEWQGRSEAQVMGRSIRLPAAHAAYVNSYLANALDFDDTYLVIGHPGAAIIPAALAVGEKRGSSGQEVLSAIVAGYEVSCRIGLAITPSMARFDQVFGLPTWHTWGAVVAAGRVLGMKTEQLANAMGVSGPHAMIPHVRKYGLEDRPVSWIKNNMGWCALGGVISADLAQRGFHGNRAFLDGETGFWIMAGSDRCDFELMTAGLGRKYHLLDVSYKPYPVCRYIHVAIDALREAMGERRPLPEQVAEIGVSMTANAARDFAVTRPTDTIDTQYSLPYALAVTFLDLPPGPAWFDEGLLKDPWVQYLSDRVAFAVDPQADEAFSQQQMVCTIRVRLVDGEILVGERPFPRGDSQDPLTPDEIDDKFITLCTPVLGIDRAARLQEAVDSMDRLGDIRVLSRLLAPPDADYSVPAL